MIAGPRAADAGERRPLLDQCLIGTAVPDPAANAALVGDCVTLLGLRDALRGRGTLDWSTGTALTNWEGVTVSGTPPRVTSIVLATRGLTGRIPPALGDLDALQRLDLTWNKLGGSIPAALGQLRDLTSLALYRNRLSGPIPPRWASCPSSRASA